MKSEIAINIYYPFLGRVVTHRYDNDFIFNNSFWDLVGMEICRQRAINKITFPDRGKMSTTNHIDTSVIIVEAIFSELSSRSDLLKFEECDAKTRDEIREVCYEIADEAINNLIEALPE